MAEPNPFKELDARLEKLAKYDPAAELAAASDERKQSAALDKAAVVFGAYNKMRTTFQKCREHIEQLNDALELPTKELKRAKQTIDLLEAERDELLARPAGGYRAITLLATTVLALTVGGATGYFFAKRSVPQAEQTWTRPAIPANGIYHLDALANGKWKDASEVAEPEKLAFYFPDTGRGSMRIKFAPELHLDIQTLISHAEMLDMERMRIRQPYTAPQYARIAAALAVTSGTVDEITKDGLEKAEKIMPEKGLAAINIDYNKPPFAP